MSREKRSFNFISIFALCISWILFVKFPLLLCILVHKSIVLFCLVVPENEFAFSCLVVRWYSCIPFYRYLLSTELVVYSCFFFLLHCISLLWRWSRKMLHLKVIRLRYWKLLFKIRNTMPDNFFFLYKSWHT